VLFRSAYDEAVRRADETLAALRRHFPGRIWLDPNGPVRPTRASDYGPIVALVVMLGKRAAPLLAELLASDSRDRRFYAALVAKEIGHPQLVYPLVARAFDHDPAVRAAAVEALAAYPAGETGRAFEQLRNALHGEAARARAAAQALRELRDASAVPDLIAALSFDRETAEEARRTLVVLTLQDHGARPKKWLAWWQKNQRRSRIEWMLDALGDRDREIRVAAGDELRRVTREDFGYHPDRPKPERDAARERWQKWWEQVGRRREISLRETPEDERTTLPPRHRPRDR